MARRKVTMLDAFKVSDRESQERVLAERRRIAADREKEARRDEASKNATEWGRRLGEGVGSWWSQLWGAEGGPRGAAQRDGAQRDGAEYDGAGRDVDRRRVDVSRDGRADLAPGSASDSSSGGPHGSDVEGAVAATPIDRRPARASSWEAPEATADVASGASLEALPDAQPDAQPDVQSGVEPDALGDSGGAAPGDAEGVASGVVFSGGRASKSSLGSPMGSPEAGALRRGAPPRAPVEAEEFSLPMSGRAFAVLLAVAVGTVFGLGMLLGGGGQVSADEGGDSDAQRSAANAGLDFVRMGPRHPEPGAAGPSPGRGILPAPSPDLIGAGSTGRSGASGAVGTEGGQPSGQVPSPSTGSVPAEGLSGAERAFFDPAMKYTILAITYTRTEANVALAWEAYDFLEAEGFPAVRPFPHKGRIFIFVGAEEAKAALEEDLLRLRSLKFPPSNRTEFRSAYPVNLSTYR